MIGRATLINKLVAKKLGVDEKRVAKVSDFFWKELTSKLSEADEPHVYVRNLGTFTLKLKNIETRIRKYIRYYKLVKSNPEKYGKRGPELPKEIKKEIYNLLKIRRMIKNNRKERLALKYKDKKYVPRVDKIDSDW